MTDQQPCERCGRAHERNGLPTCSAHRSQVQPLTPCAVYPMRGGAVCQTHGGRAPAVRAAAARRSALNEATRAMRRDLEVVQEPYRSQHPAEALLEAVARSSQAVAWLAAEVSRLTVPDPCDPGVEAFGALYDPTSGSVHPLWRELNAAQERQAKFAKLCLDAGADERQVRIAEEQGAQMAAILTQVIDGLGLGADLVARVRTLTAQALRALPPGS